MIDSNGFRNWLTETTSYSKDTISDTVSRMKRADLILPWYNDKVYQFHLEQDVSYQQLKSPIRSQIKKAVKLYGTYVESTEQSITETSTSPMKPRILSLFANIGVAEAYLEEIGFHVAVANELIERRADLYSRIYPQTKMICGDITDDTVFQHVMDESKKARIDIIMATPPCQGMSTAGQQTENDFRNTLIRPVIKAIQEIEPNYVFLENVPMIYQTSILVNDEKILIFDLLKRELEENYTINRYTIDTKKYSVPQTRERAIILMSRKGRNLTEWILPDEDKKIITMRDAIGHLPILDPYVTDVSEEERQRMYPHFEDRKKAALDISLWHNPPHHIKRQVVAMQHTPTGNTAFDNPVYFPVKADGKAVSGYHNTYKRQNWDTAAYTVTMDNRKISSQNNVHPGRPDGIDEKGEQLYSDARTLTLYEIMIIMSLPTDWPIPANTSEAFLRRIIGEGIPPLFVKKTFEMLKQEKRIDE